MPREEYETSNNGFKALSALVGIAMISVGLALTCLIGYTAYQIIETPQDVELITYVFEKIPRNVDDMVINITAKDDMSGTTQKQSVSLPKEVTIFGVALLALMAFRVVGSLAVMTTKSGADILRGK